MSAKNPLYTTTPDSESKISSSAAREQGLVWKVRASQDALSGSLVWKPEQFSQYSEVCSVFELVPEVVLDAEKTHEILP